MNSLPPSHPRRCYLPIPLHRHCFRLRQPQQQQQPQRAGLPASFAKLRPQDNRLPHFLETRPGMNQRILVMNEGFAERRGRRRLWVSMGDITSSCFKFVSKHALQACSEWHPIYFLFKRKPRRGGGTAWFLF